MGRRFESFRAHQFLQSLPNALSLPLNFVQAGAASPCALGASRTSSGLCKAPYNELRADGIREGWSCWELATRDCFNAVRRKLICSMKSFQPTGKAKVSLQLVTAFKPDVKSLA